MDGLPIGPRWGRKLKIGENLYLGVNLQTGEIVTIADEAQNTWVLCAARMLNKLAKKSVDGLPSIRWYGIQDNALTETTETILVMEQLGKSLQDLLEVHHMFSLKTVLMLAISITPTLMELHNAGVVHNSLQPTAFHMGHGKKMHRVLLADFSAAIYKDHQELGQQPPTLQFCSINAHLGFKQGLRDDLESLGYLLVCLAKGCLPWTDNCIPDDPDNSATTDVVCEKKMTIELEVLCQGLPKEFTLYFEYVRGLQYEDKPDYDCITKLFTGVLQREGEEMDYVYDWSKQ